MSLQSEDLFVFCCLFLFFTSLETPLPPPRPQWILHPTFIGLCLGINAMIYEDGFSLSLSCWQRPEMAHVAHPRPQSCAACPPAHAETRHPRLAGSPSSPLPSQLLAACLRLALLLDGQRGDQTWCLTVNLSLPFCRPAWAGYSILLGLVCICLRIR